MVLERQTSGACGPARASRTKSRGADRDDFVQAGESLCFNLDASPLSLRRVKAQALRGNKEILLPAPANRRALRPPPPSLPVSPVLQTNLCPPPVFLQARRFSAAPFVVDIGVRKPERGALRPSPFPQFDYSATGTPRPVFSTAPDADSLRGRNRKTLAAPVILELHHRMSGADSAGSKLSAWNTRQHWRRQAVPSVDNLARVAEPPVASPWCRAAAAETVPVSAPFGLLRAARKAAAFGQFEVRQ